MLAGELGALHLVSARKASGRVGKKMPRASGLLPWLSGPQASSLRAPKRGRWLLDRTERVFGSCGGDRYWSLIRDTIVGIAGIFVVGPKVLVS